MVIKLSIGIGLAIAVLMLAGHPEVREFAKLDNVPAPTAEKMSIHPSKTIEPHTEPLTTSSIPSTEVESVDSDINVPIKPDFLPVPVKSNEQIVWERLTAAGYNREQAIGIMANLQQEHGFQTSDVAGGLGIAQWIGSRRDKLMERANYLDINVQIDYLLDELNSGYSYAKSIILGSGWYGATIAFQDQFERCGDCRTDTRLLYAQQLLEKY